MDRSYKIRKEEMQGIRHFLVDVLEPEEEFHVARFQQMAKEAMRKIYEQGKIPILVGGTGFYIQAIVKDINLKKMMAIQLIEWKWKLWEQKKGMNISMIY